MKLLNALMIVLSLASSQLTAAATTEPVAEDKYIFVAVYAPNIASDAVTEVVVERFKQAFADSDVEPVIYSTTDVLSALMDGFAHIGITSRQWSDKEVTLLEKKYQQRPMALTLTAEAFALRVNDDNDIDSLTIRQLKGIYAKAASTGCEIEQANNWQTLGSSDFAEDEPSEVKAAFYAKDSRFSQSFKQNLGCALSDDLEYFDDEEAANDWVDDNINALSFTRFNPDEADSYIKLADAQGELIELREDTVFSGQYPLSNVYYLQVAPFAKESEAIKQYIDYFLSEDTQAYLADYDFMILPEAIKQRNRVKLKQAEAIIANGYR